MANRRHFALLTSLVLLHSAAAAAQTEADRKYTVITGTGQTLYRIAIPPVFDGGGGAKAAGTAQEVMNRDMTLTGLFKVLDPKSYLANLQQEGVKIDPPDWVNVGAQGVIKARATGSGKKVAIDFYLYDPAKGATAVLVKTYRGPSNQVRRLAHLFGNDVVKYYTGEPGIFTSKIAFSSGSRRSKKHYIYVMDYDGYGVYKASNTGDQNVLPAWSPNGMLAYTGFMWRNPDLYLVQSGGGRAKRISKYPGLNTGAAWSPRGDAIALTLSKDGNAEIYLISPSNGKIIRRLTRHHGIDTSPSWSPDGSRIAFVSNRDGSPQIYVMSASGGGVRRLTYQGSYNQEPDWCPRSATPLVAFTARDEKGNFDIFTVDVSSGQLKRLTQGQGSNSSPSWAPNGQLLIFSSSRGGMWISNADGLNQHRIYRGSGMTPSWGR